MSVKKKKTHHIKTKNSETVKATEIDSSIRNSATDFIGKSEELQRNVKDWQQTFDAIPHFVALISPGLEFIRLNRAGYESVGKKLQEVIGKRCCKIVHGKDAPVEGCPCLQSKKIRKPAFSELIMNGRYQMATASPVLDENGELKAFVHTIRDITERKRTEEELRKYHDQLEELVKERTDELKSINEQLQIEREALERKNIALHEVLGQFEEEKNNLKRQFITNVEQVIIPTLLRLKKSSRSFQKPIFEMLEKDLREITSPFLETIKHNHTKLSPREMEVCRLIKNGLTSKEIAEALNLSLLTVYKYRELIRKKLQLVNDGTNLRNYLQSL